MSLSSIVINQIPATNTTAYEGQYYAFYGEGGYTMDQCFNTILLHPASELQSYDVTQCLQVRYDVRTFNRKLGLLKDASNQYIVDSSFNPVTDKFPIDSISITADEFLEGMTEDYVISVGTYSNLYSDFIYYVNTYFGYAGGFSSLFAAASEFDINGGVFDASAFLKIITETPVSPSGEHVKHMTGTITIDNINKLLYFAVDTNAFNNRDPSSDYTASDPSGNLLLDPSGDTKWKRNYGVADGFVAGDLIFIPAGTTIKLHLVIDSEIYNPLNNIGPVNVAQLIQNTNYTSSNNYFSENSAASTTNIDRVLTAPLLIRLDNLS